MWFCFLSFGIFFLHAQCESPELVWNDASRNLLSRKLGVAHIAKKGVTASAKKTVKASETTAKDADKTAHQTVQCATAGSIASSAGCVAKDGADDTVDQAKHTAKNDAHEAKVTGHVAMDVKKKGRRLLSVLDDLVKANETAFAHDVEAKRGISYAMQDIANVTKDEIKLQISRGILSGNVHVFYNVSISPERNITPEELAANLRSLSWAAMEKKFRTWMKAQTGSVYSFNVSRHDVSVVYPESDARLQKPHWSTITNSLVIVLTLCCCGLLSSATMCLLRKLKPRDGSKRGLDDLDSRRYEYDEDDEDDEDQEDETNSGSSAEE